jgi:rhamnogalacturonyl hydrolase YesR
MREVNAQWIADHEDPGDNRWERATYFIGELTASKAMGDDTGVAYAERWAREHAYGINDGPGTHNSDNHCAGQTYLALHVADGTAAMLAPTQQAIDSILTSGEVDDWYWIDAQFMASPVFAQLALITGDTRYVDRMHELFVYARDRRHLFDRFSGLWYRDEHYLFPYAKTPNGQKIFWARGNGWVIASLARTMEYVPVESSYRADYEEMLVAMATALARVQRPDGLWNPSLADPLDYPGPESSGTSFFTYAMAWGINHGVLDRDTFLPVVEKAWRGLVANAVRADGELGLVQGVGERPSSSQPVTLSSTHDYGVGAFLLAGSEVLQLGLDLGCAQ